MGLEGPQAPAVPAGAREAFPAASSSAHTQYLPCAHVGAEGPPPGRLGSTGPSTEQGGEAKQLRPEQRTLSGSPPWEAASGKSLDDACLDVPLSPE